MDSFVSDCFDFAGALRSDCDAWEAVNRALRPVCEDAEALATLARACKPDQVLAGAVHSALEHLKTKRMDAFKKLLPKTAIGRVMLAEGARVLATQGQEFAANVKFQQAQKAPGGRLPAAH